MVSLSFFGGVREIGGNKILLEDGDTRVWLDFGQSFHMGELYYINWLQPRRHNGVGDYLEFNLLPRIPGLYSEDHLCKTDLVYQNPLFQGVFITHAHFDHVNHIGFLDPDIPVYTGEGTKIFMEAMEKTSPFTNYGDRFYRTFRTGDLIRMDGLELEPIHVDHSIPAAYGYIIRTSEGSIVYTGDLRSHGPRADMTEEFLEAAESMEPDVMICEGTRMIRRERRTHLSEQQVYLGVKKVIEWADRERRSVLYTHPSRDMDRFRTFYKAAESCCRKLVITPKTAYLLERLIEDEHLLLPDPVKDDLIRVYYKKKKSCKYDDTDYYVWERGYLDKIITSDELGKQGYDYLLNIDFYSFTELIDIRPPKGSPFIYSMSEPFTEEDLEDAVLHQWLKHFDLRYHQLHASGHLSRKELGEAVNRVNPGKLFPVHTEDPGLFKRYFDSVIEPEKGVIYRS